MANRRLLALGGLGTAAAFYWARSHPSACPYAMRFLVAGPHPGIPRKRLIEVLAPRPGERVLEIGPGTGYYSLDVARFLVDVSDGGRLAVFDIQQEFLDLVVRAGAKQGLENIDPTRGDASALPYEDGSFDAAFLVTVLGEIPDQDAALHELHRVLRPGGRLVVGETMVGDPHVVPLRTLKARAARAGFQFEHRAGSPLGFFALLRR